MNFYLRAVVAAIFGTSLLVAGSSAQQQGGRPPTNPQIQFYNYGAGTPHGSPYGSPQAYKGINNFPDPGGQEQQNTRLPSDRFLDTMRPDRRF